MKPWERRLFDLWLLHERCHATYMEPELFRLSINQFLQTSRTVTFIMQKHKADIAGFNSWYDPIINGWAADEVMTWAKDSRNKIEKEGDLDLYSKLTLRLFFSYFDEQDLQLGIGRKELLQAGTKRLIRIARRELPSSAVDAAAIKVERRWVANSLPTWEVLQAFNYVYATLFRMCQSLAVHIGDTMPSEIPDPTSLYPLREEAMQVAYLKLSTLEVHRQHVNRIKRDPDYSPPAGLASSDLPSKFSESKTFEEKFATLARMAQLVFEHDGFHIPMMYLFDKDAEVIDFSSTQFVDQVDKFIFWRNLADKATAIKARAVLTIGEAWIRDSSRYHSEPIRKLPITGERLFVTALDSTGWFRSKSWRIVREEGQKPKLEVIEADPLSQDIPFYYGPMLKAFGLPYPPHFNED